MNRRGFTLLELLLSLSLLSVLVVGVGSIGGALRQHRDLVRERFRAERRLDAVVQEVEDAFTTGDFEPDPRRVEPRITTSPGALEVWTRLPRWGQVLRRWEWRAEIGVLVRTDRVPVGGQLREIGRAEVLRGVVEFQVEETKEARTLLLRTEREVRERRWRKP